MPPRESKNKEYAKGTLVWLRDTESVWKAAEIIATLESEFLLKSEDTSEEIRVSRNEELHLRNVDEYTSEGLVALDDLTQLTHLHEPAVLHALEIRFDIDKIYTFTGPILIALNPFKRIPGLYDDETMRQFINIKAYNKPHVFATSLCAFKGICDRGRNQTVLISGESGAGKTETTKFVMKFLASAGSADGAKTPVENQVLQSNPLLEAFGNGRTLRNDNSSRFGKFIELQFQPSGSKISDSQSKQLAKEGIESNPYRLCGARVQTYLLEKVRVTDQQEGERNFHIFYQACAAASAFPTANKQYIFPQFFRKADVEAGLDPSQMVPIDLRGFADHSQFRLII